MWGIRQRTIRDLTGCAPALRASARGAFALIAAILLLSAAGSAPALAAKKHVLKVSAQATSEPTCQSASAENAFETIAGAIACAAPEDTISVGPGTFAGGITIPANLTLAGAGANYTKIADEGMSGVQELTIAPGANVTVEKLTISGAGGGGVENSGILAGSGTLLLREAAVRDTNFASQAALQVTPNSGVANVTVLDSTISDGHGGGVYVAGTGKEAVSTLLIANSTISGNEGSQDGGVQLLDASAALVDDTVAHNYGSTAAGGLLVGAGSQATLTNTILANNETEHAPWSDCAVAPGSSVSGSSDLIGISSPGGTLDCGFVDDLDGVRAGSPSSPLDPLLAPLAENGGGTETLAPMPGSPAIETGAAATCEGDYVEGLDQRGVKRHASKRGACDVGAYDTAGKVKPTTWRVSPKASSNPSCATASSKVPFQAIAAALACAHDRDTIKLAAGTYAGGFTIPLDVRLVGAGANKTTIASEAKLAVPEITIANGPSVTIEGLTVSGRVGAGQENSDLVAGSGTLRLLDSVLTEGDSGGKQNLFAEPSEAAANVEVSDSTISHGRSGGIYVASPSAARSSTLTLVDSTVSDNESDVLGGVAVKNTQATLRDDTIAGNYGGDVGGLFVAEGSSATVTNTLLAGNEAQQAIWDDCRLWPGQTLTGGFDVVGVAVAGGGSDCGFVGLAGSHAGTVAMPLAAGLGPLALDGGRTPTQALLAGSPAIGAGEASDCLAEPVDDRDQRGASRDASTRGKCDVGAYDTGGG
jgi:hypothetical protein